MATADAEELLVVAAEARELAGLLKRCRRSRRLGWPLNFVLEAELNGRPFLLVANGWGRGRAAEACEVALGRRRLAACISAGFCGALSPALKAGQIFIAQSVENLNRSLCFQARLPLTFPAAARGKLVTLDRVVQSSADKRALFAQGWQAVDMEALAVAASAARCGLPFYCIRAVSDLADESFFLDFNKLRKTNGLPNRLAILRQLGRRPYPVVLELIRLYKRSRLASKALGDFLASCTF